MLVLPTISCGTPGILRPSSARGAPGLHRRSARYPIFILAASPTPRFAKARTKSAPGTACSWAGRCAGTRPRATLDTLLAGRRVGLMHIVCYLRQGRNVFETYWTTIRGVEAMDNNHRLLDLTVRGQEMWEDSPAGWTKGDDIMATPA